MKSQVKKIFIGATSEIRKEVYEIASEAVDKINEELRSDPSGLRFALSSWKDIAPDIQDRLKAQEVIDKQLLRDDILMAFFCNRYGSDCGDEEHLSGVAHEIELMMKKGKKVLVYFLNKELVQDDIDEEAYKQILLLRAYKNKLFQTMGLAQEYKFEELPKVLERDIRNVIQQDNDKDEEYNKFRAQMFYHNYLYTEDAERKLRCINLAIDFDSTEPNYYFTRSILYHKSRDFQNEIEDLSRAIELSDNPWNYYLSRSIIYHNAKNYRGALKDIDEVIKSMGRQPLFLLSRATHLYKLYQFDEAAEILRSTAKELRDNAMAYAYLAIALIRANVKELKADEIMRKNLELPDALLQEVKQAITVALQCRDKNKYDYIFLAKTYIMLRDFGRANEMLNKAAAIRKNIGEIYYLKSKIAHYQHNPKEEGEQLALAKNYRYVEESNGDWLL